VQNDFLNKLKEFGLNSYESKLWTALLSRGVSTAGELSDIANVPRSRTYDVLESLEKKGFIIMKVGKPIKYIAVPPTEVIERVKKRIISDAEEKSVILDNVQNSKILTELTALHSQGIDLVDPIDLSGAIKGRNNLLNHIESMVKNAKESILIMTSEEGITRKYTSLKTHLKKAKSKGVKIMVSAPLSKTSDVYKELSKIAEINNLSSTVGRFVLVDNKEGIFMLSDDTAVHPSFDSGIWITSPYFTKSLSNMFQTTWKN